MKGEGYAAHEEGNTLSFAEFQQYLDDTLPQFNLSVDDHITPRMKDIIIDTFLSVRHKMNPNNRKHCYELFGFDFLLDEDLRLWLIEVNVNPFLGTPNAHMREMVPQMMNDMFKIVLDPFLKPNNVPDSGRPNHFDLVYREEGCSKGPPVNVRRSFEFNLLYPVPELTPLIGKTNGGKSTINTGLGKKGLLNTSAKKMSNSKTDNL